MSDPLPETSFLGLKKDEFKDLLDRLRLFTYGKYGKDEAKLSLDLEDQIMQAISDTHNGIRRYPPIDKDGLPRQDVSLCAFLCMVIRSNISHFLEKNKNVVSLDEWMQAHELNNTQNTLSSEPKWSWLSWPRETAQQKEDFILLCYCFRKVVEGDSQLTDVVNLLIEDPSLKPGEIAHILGLSRNELRNAQQRLTKRIHALKEGWNREQN